jgi:tetratricopeptide (TPR) repeat protein
LATPSPSVRVYYQVVEDPREKAQGRFLRFQTFDESDMGRGAARSSRFVPTARLLPRGEFERNRERIIPEVKRAAGLDRKEKELQADYWTKEAAVLARAGKHQEAITLLKKALGLVPAHLAAKQTLAEVERMIKAPSVPSAEQFQLLAQIRSMSYQIKVDGKPVNRSGSVLSDYLFCPKGHVRSGYQPWGSRTYSKAEILRDHAKIVEAVLRDKNLVVARLTRGNSKAIFWTKKGPSGWQADDCCTFRDLKEPRALLVKGKVPLQA